MSRRQLYLGILGLIIGLIGLAAMLIPVYLDQFDMYGIQVTCGNGLSSHLRGETSAALASRCGSALLERRLWAIPTLAAGWMIVTWFVVAWARVQQNDTAESEHRALDRVSR